MSDVPSHIQSNLLMDGDWAAFDADARTCIEHAQWQGQGCLAAIGDGGPRDDDRTDEESDGDGKVPDLSWLAAQNRW